MKRIDILIVILVIALFAVGCGAPNDEPIEVEATVKVDGAECAELSDRDTVCAFDFDGQRCIVFKGYRKGGLDCRPKSEA